MQKEIRTVCYDEDLHLEAYRFEGIVQPFPNHFHDYYVIGFMESGTRCLSNNMGSLFQAVFRNATKR